MRRRSRGLAWGLRAVAAAAAVWVVSNPLETGAALTVLARALATTVESGHHGVIFRFGRFHRIAEPGLVWLIPWVDQLQHWQTRSTTLHLAPQQVAAADGRVFEVVATFVLRVERPDLAAVQVADLFAGARDLCGLAAGEVLRRSDLPDGPDRWALDAELANAAARRLRPWGVGVEHAAFTTFSPTAPTLRITQLGPTTRERRRVAERLGDDLRGTLLLLGGPRWLSRSRRRYRQGPLPRLGVVSRAATPSTTATPQHPTHNEVSLGSRGAGPERAPTVIPKSAGRDAATGEHPRP